MWAERILRLQDSKIFFLSYLSLPFVLCELTNNNQIFYFYFIATLILVLLTCILRILRKDGNKDYDIAALTVIKIGNICTILYTPKPVWIISGLIIFSLFLSFAYRHSRIGAAEITKHKFYFFLYLALYLTIFFKSVPCGYLLGIYGVQLAFVFSYLLLCALKTKMFYRGILYGSASMITLVLIGRYSVETLSMFYLYVESVFIGLCYVCYLNWYKYGVYMHFLSFVKKRKKYRFFNLISLMHTIAIVALAIIVFDLPLTKAVIIDSCLAAALIWIAYSAVIGFLNLGENSKDIADYDDDDEIIQYYLSLPEQIKLNIKNEIVEFKARKQRCNECKQIYDKLNSMPKFMQHINNKSDKDKESYYGD